MGPFRISEGDLVTQDIEKAKALNTFFTSLHQQVLQPYHPYAETQRRKMGEWRTILYGRRLGWRPFKETEVAKFVGPEDMYCIGPEGTGWGSGYANMHHIWEVLALQSAEIPKDWKRRNVILIFKKENKEDS